MAHTHGARSAVRNQTQRVRNAWRRGRRRCGGQGDRNAVLASSASARGKNGCDVRSRTLGQASRRTASLGPARTDGSSRLGLDGGPSFDRRCSFVPARRARRASYQTSSTGAPAPTFSTASAALASHCTTPHRRVRVPSCDLRAAPVGEL